MASASGGYPAQEQPEADNTVTRITLHQNGSATWTITFRTRLTTDEDMQEYRRFQESFRENTSRYLDPFRTRMSGVVANADVDRDTRATDFGAETAIQEVPRRWGVVRYEFTWHGFAAVDGDDVVVGDAFAGGFYIGEGDVLEIAAPNGYTVAATEPTPNVIEDGVAEWRGREDFADGQPRFVAEPPVDATPAPADDETEETEEDESPVVLWGAGLLIAVSAAVVGIVWSRRTTGGLRETAATVLGGLGPGADVDDAAVEGDSAAVATSDEESGAGGPAAAADDSDATDESLLTDEDRVRSLLRDRGGRVKQADLADAFDWSDSKTSRVVSRMADDDAIRKLRIGRENVVELPDDGR